MLATSKNVLFPVHNHLLTAGTDDPSLAATRAIIKVSGHQYQWLAGVYDLEIGHFLDVASMVVTWWIVAFGTVLTSLTCSKFLPRSCLLTLYES